MEYSQVSLWFCSPALCIHHLCYGYRGVLGSIRSFAQATEYSDNPQGSPCQARSNRQHCCLTINVPCDQKQFRVSLTYQGPASQHPPGVVCHAQAEEGCGDTGGGIQPALKGIKAGH